jgi:hypothetical protein
MAQFDGALKAFRSRHHGHLPWHGVGDRPDWYLTSYDEEGEEGEDEEGEEEQEDEAEDAGVDSARR